MIIDLIFDGDIRGVYINEAVQQYAVELGYPSPVIGIDEPDYNEGVSDAIEWLNENIADRNEYYELDYHFYYKRYSEKEEENA